jgi:hypothetical protein
MAKKALVYSPAKWASLDEAFALAKAALGSGSAKHTLQDLHDRMRDGSLPSAVRRLEPDGTAVLPLSFWGTVSLREGFGPGPDGKLRRSGTVRVHDRGEPLYSHGADRVYFVLRSDLDKLYPPAPQAEQAGQEAKTAHRKPGRKTTKNWQLHVAGELHRIVVVEKKPVPPASHFAKFCDDKLNYHPDIRAVQRLLKLLIG